MGYGTLISLAKYLVITLILCAIVYVIHNNGRKVERAEWLQKEIEEKARLQVGINQIINHVRTEEHARHENTILALNERDKQIEDYDRNYNALLATNDRLRFKASGATCSKPLPRESKSASVSDGEITIELPREIESGIRAIGRDIERELINCNTLRDIVSPVIEVMQ